MAIPYRAPASRPWRRAALVTAALVLGVGLAWLLRPGARAPDAAVPAVVHAPATAEATVPAAIVDAGCDARCAAAKVMVPATTACSASVEQLASFGVRSLDADAATPRFDRFARLQAARGSVTLGGGRAEFRNAAGAWLPVDYDCDFDPATPAVLEARARPRAFAPVAAAALTFR